MCARAKKRKGWFFAKWKMTELVGQRHHSAFTLLTGLANNSVYKLTVDKKYSVLPFFSLRNKELDLLLVIRPFLYFIFLEIILFGSVSRFFQYCTGFKSVNTKKKYLEKARICIFTLDTIFLIILKYY